LSNSFPSVLFIDGKLWENAAEYIYSNMFIGNCSTLYSSLLRGGSVEDISNKYVELNTKCENDIIKESTRIAIEEKFKNPQLISKLVETGIRSIVFHNDNNLVLGVNEKGEGENYLGTLLEKIRRENQGIKGGSLLYQVYKASKVLEKDAENGVDIYTEYNGLSYDDIIKKYEERVGNEIQVEPLNIVKKMYIDGSLKYVAKEVRNPGNLVQTIAKDMEKIINAVNAKKNVEGIFDAFVDKVMGKYFPDKNVAFRNRQLNMLSEDERINLIERVYKLEQLKGVISELNLITDREYVFVSGRDPLPIEDVKDYQLRMVDPIYVYPELEKIEPKYRDFSNRSETYPFAIKGKYFPSVAHYNFVVHLSNTTEGDAFNEDYKLIVAPNGAFYSVDELVKTHQQLRMVRKTVEVVKRALLYKFLNPELRAKLVELKEEIVYESDNSLLGMKNGTGLNIVGRCLMNFRKTIKESYSQYLKELPLVNSKVNEMLADNALNSWLADTIARVCYTYTRTASELNKKINNSMLFTYMIRVLFMRDGYFFTDSEIPDNIKSNISNLLKGENSMIPFVWSYVLSLVHKTLHSNIKDLVRFLATRDSSISIGEGEPFDLKAYQAELTNMKIPDAGQKAFFAVFSKLKVLDNNYIYNNKSVEYAMSIIAGRDTDSQSFSDTLKENNNVNFFAL
jgi:predicted NAD-dependent protein-ADP-ribosyltransferase YbiA (DUF1768 family)